MVEIRETVQEIRVPKYVEVVESAKAKKQLFSGVSDGELLGYGIPPEWLDEVRKADEDTLFAITDHLPAEAAEALIELAVGGRPTLEAEPCALIAFARDEVAHLDVLEPDETEVPAFPIEGLRTEALRASFEHPDAQRRFRIIHSSNELARALEFPWEKWTVFLHPEQRALVERSQSGPARVSGSAGTGKTIVALHRAVFLAKQNPNGRVLLATYSEPLANALATRLRRLISNEPRLGDRIDVAAIPAVGARLYRALVGPLKLVNRKTVVQLMNDAAGTSGDSKFSMSFLMSEWDQVVDASQIDSWEGYRDVGRLGRKTRLREDRRKTLWGFSTR